MAVKVYAVSLKREGFPMTIDILAASNETSALNMANAIHPGNGAPEYAIAEVETVRGTNQEVAV